MNAESGYERTLDFLDSISIGVPCTKLANLLRFRIHAFQKEFDQAEEYSNLHLEQGGVLHLLDSVNLAYMYQQLGKEEEALAIMNRSQISYLKRLARNKNSDTLLRLSIIHALKEEREESLQYLSDAAELGFLRGWHDFVEINPTFESLWDDPEFKASVKQAQEEKAALLEQVREMEARGELTL